MKRIFSRKNLFDPYSVLASMIFILAFAAIGVTLLFQSHAQSTCTPNANFVNPCRPWFGAAVGGNPGAADNTQPTQFAYLDTLVGHSMDIYRDYVEAPAKDTESSPGDTVPLSGSPGQNEVYFAKNNKVVALNINWNPANKFQDAESTGNGGTAYVNSLINQAAANFATFQKNYPNIKVFLTAWHEINLHTTVDTPSCSPNPVSSYGTAADFVAAWQNIHNIFQAHGVHDVLWTLGYSSQTSSQCEIPIDWPGSQYVNWIDYDSYDHGDNPNKSTWDTTIGAFYDYLKSVPGSVGEQINAVPWGVGEFGTGQNPSPTNAMDYYSGVPDSSGNITPVSTSGAYAVQHNLYPNLKMYLIFADYVPHTNIGALTNYDSDGTLDPKKQAAVNNLVDAIYGSSSNPAPTPTVTLSPTTGTTISGGSAAVSANASVSSGSITGLVLKAHGQILKTCTNTASCTGTWNTAALANGNYTVTTIATASGGGSKTVSHTVTVSNVTHITISPPTNITSPSQTTNSITLSWNAAQDSGYPASQLTYDVYRNGGANPVGSTAAGVTTYTDTKLTPGTYYNYTLRTIDPAGNKSVLTTPFPQNTKPPNCAKPAAPAGLTASATSPTTVSLSWQPVPPPSSSCKVDHYLVERDGVAVGQPNATSYDDSGLTADTEYTYSVLAVLVGNIGGDAASVSVTTQKATQPDPGPTPPTNLSATPVGNTQINLTWNPSSDPVTGIKQYDVLRNGTQVGQTSTTSFGDTGLQAHTTYSYQVKAVSGGGKTASSDTVKATTLDTLPPTTPTNVQSPNQTSTSITLGWQASTDPVYASSKLIYNVTRDGTSAGSTAAGTTSYTDSKLSPGTTYSYAVIASDPSGNVSAPSKPFQQITKKVCSNAPIAPQGVIARATSPTTANINWQAVPPPSVGCTIDHYAVERNGVAIATTRSLSFGDTSLTANTTYTYAVLAVTNDNTAGALSSAVHVTTPTATDTTPPTPPSHVVAIAVNGSQINLTWNPSSDPQSGIKQYEVMRNGSQVGTVQPSSTPSFGDSGLSANTTYDYRIIAVNGVGLTASSTTVQGTTLSSTSPVIPGGTTSNSGTPATASPLLIGTHSVGSGSENGGSSSQNPTAAGSGVATVPFSQSSSPPHRVHSHTVAYVTGSIIGVLLLAGVALGLWQRRLSRSLETPDPDLYQATVVRPADENNPNNNKDKEQKL